MWEMKEGEYYTKSLAKNHVYAKFNMQEIWKIFKGQTQTMGFLGVLFTYQFIITVSVKVQNSNHKSTLSSTLTLAFFYCQKITLANSQAVKIIQLLREGPC